MSDREIDNRFADGEWDQAIERLEKGLAEEGDGNDELLYLLDLGLVHHTAGNYKESNKYFLEADKIAEIKDYTALQKEAATLLVSDNIKHYKGEDFEKVLINTYLAINFGKMGNLESALVETRRVNRKLWLMIHEGKRKYKLNAFARYLSGVYYEMAGEYDNAYISYKQAYDLQPTFHFLGRDLWRTAFLSRRFEDLGRWEKEYELSIETKTELRGMAPSKGKGEIIVIFENGLSPRKVPHPNFHSVPQFRPRFNPVDNAIVKINGKEMGQTYVLYDIESIAIQNLDEKWGGILAKKIAGVVAKEVAGEVVARQTDNPLLGFLTKVVLHAADQADVRSWNLLPKDLQLARYVLDPGEYQVTIDPRGADPLPEMTVRILPGKKTIVNQRYVP